MTVRPSWHETTRWRRECAERFGGTGGLPILSPADELRRRLRPGARVLDIGAGVDQSLRPLADECGAAYFSLDPDPAGSFDYRSFEEMDADTVFNAMFASQVLEHLTPAEASLLVEQAGRHLAPGGWFMATVPNAAHPVRQWADATHISAWPAGDLYGLFRAAGLTVETMARFNKFPLTRNPFKRIVIHIVCETFRVDWCDTVFIVGSRDES